MNNERDKFAKNGYASGTFAKSVGTSALTDALIPIDEESPSAGALIPIDDEPTLLGELIPVDDAPIAAGALIPVDDRPARTAAPKVANPVSVAAVKPACAAPVAPVNEEVLSKAKALHEGAITGDASEADGKNVNPTNGANVTRKTTKKTPKNIRKAEIKAALKNLKALKKQIKNGELPLSPPEPGPEDDTFYGERLPYPGGFPVYCCKYVIITDGKRKLAMRFFNASDILVTGLRFTLTEKDANGDVIAVRKQERTGLFAERGTEFAVADAEVERGCVSVEIRVEVVKSDMYEYVIDDAGNVSLRYGESDPTSEFYFKNERSFTIKKQRRWYVAFAVLAVVCITAIVVGVSLKLGILDKVQRNTVDTGSSIIYEISGGDLYVEA